MKPRMLSLVLVSMLSATVLTHSQQAPDPFADPKQGDDDLPKMVRVQAEFIEMPQALYTKLMAGPKTSANDTDLRAKCAKLIKDNKAKMVETMSVISLPGQYATSESITEYVYPTEADYDSFIPLADPPMFLQFPGVPGGPRTPAAFDTKNVGSTFEVEVQIDTSLTIVELRLNPTIVYHADTMVWGTWEYDGAKVEDTMPLFYVLKTRTGATVIAGETQMIASLTPQNQDGFADSKRKVMLFVRADIITVGK